MPRVLPEEFSLMSCVIRHDKVPLYPGPGREETETYSMMLYHNNYDKYENVLYKLYKYQYCISHIEKHLIMDANWVFTMPHLSVGRQVKLKETWPKPFLVGGFNPSEKKWWNRIVSPGVKMKKISETATWQLDKSSDQRASHWRIRCPDSCPSLTVSNHLSYLAIVSISYLDFVFRYLIW